jgi:hypothetical protein
MMLAIPPSSTNLPRIAVACGLQRAQLKELAKVAVHGLAVVLHRISRAIYEFLQRHQHRGLHPRVRMVAARAVDHGREALHCGDGRSQFRPEDGRVKQALGKARGGVGGGLGQARRGRFGLLQSLGSRSRVLGLGRGLLGRSQHTGCRVLSLGRGIFGL